MAVPDHVTATDARHMLVSGECCRWGWVRACFAFLEVHAFNETVRDGINVPHLTIRKDIATKAFHELVLLCRGFLMSVAARA